MSTLQRTAATSHVTRAWSCTVRLVVGDPRALAPAAADLDAVLARVGRAASRFRTDSALSLANRRAGRPTPVSGLLVELVAVALDAAARTDGAVDPTLGRHLARLGYDRDIDLIRAGGAAAASVPEPYVRVPATWRDVRLDRGMGLLTVPRGSALDLGATAKAWTADHAANVLAARYGTAVLVELGGDLAVAGDRAGGWLVRVAEREGGDGQVVTLRAGGLATSTTTLRTWRQDGRHRHHVLDPRTGQPVDGLWRTASVAARSALAANAASTAALVKGDDALAWLEANGLPARLVGRDGDVAVTSTWPIP